MPRSLLLLTAVVLGLSLSAQEATRELTLRDAVTYGGGRLRPQGLQQLQWISGGTDLSFVKDDVLYGASVGKRSDAQLLTIGQLNEQLTESDRVKAFPTITWQGPQRFTFISGTHLHTYDLTTGRLETGCSFPPDAEHLDVDPTGQRVAFTNADNLFLAGGDPLGPIPITTDGGDGIVSGRSVHRDEYGITKGTFWSPTGTKIAFYRMDESMVTRYELEHINTQPSTFAAIRYPMAGQASHQVRVGIYDVAAGTTVFLKHNGAPDDYLTNLSWTPDGKQVCVIHLDRATQNIRVVLYDAGTGEQVRILLEEHDDKWLEPLHPVHFLQKERGRFLHFSQRDGWRHLYLYGDQGPIRQLTTGEWTVSRIIGLDTKENFVFVEGTAKVDPQDPVGALEMHLYRVDLTKGTTVRLTKSAGQ
ncbi:MAG TPA: DPP IV N-terminal domain-containing protein, partial [Flavobacteriales bacterium]